MNIELALFLSETLGKSQILLDRYDNIMSKWEPDGIIIFIMNKFYNLPLALIGVNRGKKLYVIQHAPAINVPFNLVFKENKMNNIEVFRDSILMKVHRYFLCGKYSLYYLKKFGN